MNPIVYIAGPYIGDGTYKSIDANIKFAESYAIKLAKAGVQFFCPHTHTRHFETIHPHISEQFFLSLDLQILSFCHALLTIPGWRRSKGTALEIEYAKKLRLPIFTDVRKVISWAVQQTK